MKFILVSIVVMALHSISMAAPAEKNGADAQAVNAACAQDSATAGCESKKVGTGLLKCLHLYKKSHHEHKFSEGCKNAMKQMREHRKSPKAK